MSSIGRASGQSVTVLMAAEPIPPLAAALLRVMANPLPPAAVPLEKSGNQAGLVGARKDRRSDGGLGCLSRDVPPSGGRGRHLRAH